MSTPTIACPQCARTFVNAKRHATHVAQCRIPVPVSDACALVELDGALYFRADDLTMFYPDTRTGRDVLSACAAPEDQVAYATISPKRGVWKASTASVKVSRALLRAPWARANVTGLDAHLAQMSGSEQAAGGRPPAATPPPNPVSKPHARSQQQPSMMEIYESLRLKAAEMDLVRAQVALLAAQASERRAIELHAKELEALERRTAAYVASVAGAEAASE